VPVMSLAGYPESGNSAKYGSNSFYRELPEPLAVDKRAAVDAPLGVRLGVVVVVDAAADNRGSGMGDNGFGESSKS
jgi:hypothetical protein